MGFASRSSQAAIRSKEQDFERRKKAGGHSAAGPLALDGDTFAWKGVLFSIEKKGVLNGKLPAEKWISRSSCSQLMI